MALITQLPLFVCKSKNKKTTAITGIGGISWLMTRRSPQVEWPSGDLFWGTPVMQGWLDGHIVDSEVRYIGLIQLTQVEACEFYMIIQIEKPWALNL